MPHSESCMLRTVRKYFLLFISVISVLYFNSLLNFTLGEKKKQEKQHEELVKKQ